MLTRVYSAALRGIEAIEVEIEVNATRGLPQTIVVGLPDVAVRESGQRVFTAVANSGFRVELGRKVINLAPADLKKEGPIYDLPIALGVIGLAENFPEGVFEKAMIVGELALDGRVRPMRGALAMAIEARRLGRKAVIVPQENASEAAVVDGVHVYGVATLLQAVELLRGESGQKPLQVDRAELFSRSEQHAVDLADVKGQLQVKRALEVAATGGHNLLMIGPPGTGKSMIAQRLATILPPMSEAEALETTKIHSIAGLLSAAHSLVVTRPFRATHHTVSDAGLLGGGSSPGPGEVSLAHNGVLFLDELPEFRRTTLEVMRQPLEDRQVTITRAAGSLTFPARFQLVAAMNPCPCGYFGDPVRACRCSRQKVENYRNQISGPLLDRIDLHVEVPSLSVDEMRSAARGEESALVRQRVVAARSVQGERYATDAGVMANAFMTPKLMAKFCELDAECDGLLRGAMSELNLSARAHDRILRVARTIADLAVQEKIMADHLLEAIQFRSLDRDHWG